MKPIIRIGKWWFFGKKTVGMTLFPFILIDRDYFNRVSEKTYAETINHETIHIRQALEMLVVGFYLWYVVEWLIKLFRYGKSAYVNLSFEREAYFNAMDLDYLKDRKFWAFIKYLTN